jgi:aspartyl-tRNA(Asn)/glutamyl-tRNA(Gln) amidotransferase subunit A
MPAPASVEVQVEETYRNWWDLCGFPALSLPCGFSTNPANLPIGLQVAAKPFQEPVIFTAAQSYEIATDWHKRHPAL